MISHGHGACLTVIFISALAFTASSVNYKRTDSKVLYPKYITVYDAGFAEGLQSLPSHINDTQYVPVKNATQAIDQFQEKTEPFSGNEQPTIGIKPFASKVEDDNRHNSKSVTIFDENNKRVSSVENTINKRLYQENPDSAFEFSANRFLKLGLEDPRMQNISDRSHRPLSLNESWYVSSSNHSDSNDSGSATISPAIDLPLSRFELQIPNIPKEILGNRNLVSKSGSEEREATNDIKISQIFGGISNANFGADSAYLKLLDAEKIASIREKRDAELRRPPSDIGTVSVTGFEGIKSNIPSQNILKGVINGQNDLLGSGLRNYLRQGLKQLFAIPGLTTNSDRKIFTAQNTKSNDIKTVAHLENRRSHRSLRDVKEPRTTSTAPITLESYARGANREDTLTKYDTHPSEQHTSNIDDLIYWLINYVGQDKNITGRDNTFQTASGNPIERRESWAPRYFSPGSKDRTAMFKKEAVKRLPTERTENFLPFHNGSNAIFLSELLKILDIRPHYEFENQPSISTEEKRPSFRPQSLKQKDLSANRNKNSNDIVLGMQALSSLHGNGYNRPILRSRFYGSRRFIHNRNSANAIRTYSNGNSQTHYSSDDDEDDDEEDISADTPSDPASQDNANGNDREKDIVDYDAENDIENNGDPDHITTDYPKPWVTKSPNPWITESPNPWVTESPNPWVTEAPNPWVTEAPNPWVTEAPKRWVTESPNRWAKYSPSWRPVHPSGGSSSSIRNNGPWSSSMGTHRNQVPNPWNMMMGSGGD